MKNRKKIEAVKEWKKAIEMKMLRHEEITRWKNAKVYRHQKEILKNKKDKYGYY